MTNIDRVAGVLASVTSLPGPHGIGDFGESSYAFVDLLSENGFSLWQILPLNPIGYGHSPYQPFSSYAIDEQFISLSLLKKEGLLDKAPAFHKDATRVPYEEVRAYKLPLLRKAFEKDMALHPHSLSAFKKANPWVKEWAIFSMFHRKYPRSWSEWPERERDFLRAGGKLTPSEKEDATFEIWLQKKAYAQWNKLHAYANKKGIRIIGDIPFYVGFDSCDVYGNLNAFLIDERTIEPTFIAGVPPDYFSATGQRWGNPIYDWDYLKATDYAFLQERILRASKVYDVIRLDHFRAFDTFWKIPSSCPTAIEGAWIEAPGYEFFDSLFRKDPSLKERIIAEDLGDLRPEVLVLRDHYDFPGMNVIEFTFHDAEILHRDGFDAVNSVCYLGTHDNDTMLSYFKHLDQGEQGAWISALDGLGIEQGPIVDRMVSYCLSKPGKWAILSLQDILGLDEDARTNIPSTVNAVNWTFRVPSLSLLRPALRRLRKKIQKCGRAA